MPMQEPITLEELKEWRRHPTTQKVWTFLNDLVGFRSAQWARGVEMTALEQGQVVMLARLSGDLHGVMREFYGWPEEQAEDGE